MNTIQQVIPRFNMPVTTPDGPGYLVARDGYGKVLVSVKPKESKGPGRHLWYWPNQIEELRNLCQPSMTEAKG